jgi:hypothetical protein
MIEDGLVRIAVVSFASPRTRIVRTSTTLTTEVESTIRRKKGRAKTIPSPRSLLEIVFVSVYCSLVSTVE